MKNVGQRKTANAEIERETDRLKAVERERDGVSRAPRHSVVEKIYIQGRQMRKYLKEQGGREREGMLFIVVSMCVCVGGSKRHGRDMTKKERDIDKIND